MKRTELYQEDNYNRLECEASDSNTHSYSLAISLHEITLLCWLRLHSVNAKVQEEKAIFPIT